MTGPALAPVRSDALKLPGRHWLAAITLALCLLLPNATMAGLSADAAAAPRPTAITVVLDDNYPPYIFRDAAGSLQGMLKDQWELWSARTGISVDLQGMDWALAQKSIQAGKADVIDTIFDTESRRKTYAFSAPYADIPVSLYFHRSIGGIVDADSLRGFTVGVKAGDACVEKLRTHNVDAFHDYPSYEALVKAAGAGQVRVMCIDRPPADYLLYKLGLAEQFRFSAPIYTGAFHRAVRKENTALLAIVEEGFDTFTAAERQRLVEKWQGEPLQQEWVQLLGRYAAYLVLAIVTGVALLAAWNQGLRSRVRQKTAELELARDHLAATLAAIPDLLFEVGADGRYWDCRAARPDLLAAPPEQLLGRTVNEVMPENAAVAVMAALRQAETTGTSQGVQLRLDVPAGERWFELSVARKAAVAGQGKRFIVLSRDITERRNAEAEIERLAFYDPLTHLPNRRLLLSQLQRALAISARHQRHGALLFIDLDNFKTLNDTQGHSLGDRLLIEVAQRLRGCVRAGDSIARLGGDEFVVMLEDLGESATEAAAQADAIAEKILAAIHRPYLLDDKEQHSSASIGISLFLGTAASIDELLKRADAAMYRAKAAGRNTQRFFDPELQASLEARSHLERDLRQALSGRQLALHYQPQVRSNRDIFGAEALLRWHHPLRGAVAPGEFIPLAEETGLILPIGRWVLETACAQLKAWDNEACNAALRALQLSVNVSARQFRQPGFVDEVRAILAGSGANPARLKLELTESLVLDDVQDSIEKMQQLRQLGIAFALDDFGTGYSSLSYLKRLPLEELKIDQSFVRDIASDPGDAAIVQTIIGMAATLGMHTVAEGVETAEQWKFLARNGCRAFQGYFFGRPVPLEEFEALAKSAG
ncbi:MAG: EAL domain-containing protein [Gammaproteobacteria bacterium]|nr:EAL domain-containing protein [Gammaproteobacteria bacterium]MBU1644890.1 EAL domain-containing protein [Gammaproteobacteria bacterium]MBU1971349.1 EAL domain-containing protein [Gammaproteobacteria bacterium]